MPQIITDKLMLKQSIVKLINIISIEWFSYKCQNKVIDFVSAMQQDWLKNCVPLFN